MLSNIDICNRALVAIGANPIAAFDSGSAESIAAGALYDAVVDGELSRHRWNFTAKVAKLSRLVERPIHRWTYLYQLPGDCLLVRSLWQDGSRAEYQVIEKERLASDAEAPVLEYEYRPSEALWRPHFYTLIQGRLEAYFIGALRKDIQLRDKMLEQQDQPKGVLSHAKTLDAQEAPPIDLPQGPIARARGRLR